MFIKFDDMQEFGLSHFNAATAATGAAAKALQTVTDEAIGYSEKRLETQLALGEKLARVRGVEDLLEAQSNFARLACEDFIAQARKFSDLYMDLARGAMKQSPFFPALWTA
jgi:hypothetical protein